MQFADGLLTVEAEAGLVAASAVKAAKIFNMTNANADLTYTADATGLAGNSIGIVHSNPGAINKALAVTVVGKVITVSLATDGAGAITTTAAQVKTAIEALPAAAALVDVAYEGTGAGVVNAMAGAYLTGGKTAVTVAQGVKVRVDSIVVNGGDYDALILPFVDGLDDDYIMPSDFYTVGLADLVTACTPA